MALKAEGYDWTVWDEWSKNDTRYKAGECERNQRNWKQQEHHPHEDEHDRGEKIDGLDPSEFVQPRRNERHAEANDIQRPQLNDSIGNPLWSQKDRSDSEQRKQKPQEQKDAALGKGKGQIDAHRAGDEKQKRHEA